MVGSLLWASRLTRLDIHNAVMKLSHAILVPTPDHFDAIKRVFQDLKGTIDMALTIKRSLTNTIPYSLSAYSDSNYRETEERSRIVSGLFILFLGTPVVWTLRLQLFVALSTTDVEYIALSDAARDFISVANLLVDLFGHNVLHRPHARYFDNKNAILASGHISSHYRVRHIDLRYHNTVE